MGKRSNLFQKVVATLYEHLADGASVNESEMLVNRLTEEEREVDVVLRTKTAGHELIIGVEATGLSDESRKSAGHHDPVSVEWVERMAGKHRNLPTDKLILVSETGFTDQARKLAVKENLVPISPEILGDGDPSYGIVNAVRSLWPKQIDMTPYRARLWVDHPEKGVSWFHVPQNLDVYLREDVSCSVEELITACAEGPDFLARVWEEADLANVSESMETEISFWTGPGWTLDVEGKPISWYVGRDVGGKIELDRIDALEITVKVEVRVQEIVLHHRRLAEIDVNYAFGEWVVGDTHAVLIASENEKGGKVTIRSDLPGKSKSKKKRIKKDK